LPRPEVNRDGVARGKALVERLIEEVFEMLLFHGGLSVVVHCSLLVEVVSG
jgi:hypothetical protein